MPSTPSSLVELLDQREQLLLAASAGQEVLDRIHADALAGPLLALDVGAARGVVAHEHHGQARGAAARLPRAVDLVGELRRESSLRGQAVDHDGFDGRMARVSGRLGHEEGAPGLAGRPVYPRRQTRQRRERMRTTRTPGLQAALLPEPFFDGFDGLSDFVPLSFDVESDVDVELELVSVGRAARRGAGVGGASSSRCSRPRTSRRPSARRRSG